MKVKYSANNSGGIWWITDDHWHEMKARGWYVDWFKDGEPMVRGGRFLGALARSAEKDFETPGDAMREIESITGQNVSEEGCNCCGPPHSFEWGKGDEWTYASGEECLKYMFKKVPRSLRDACE